MKAPGKGAERGRGESVDWKAVEYTFLTGDYGWHLRLRIW